MSGNDWSDDRDYPNEGTRIDLGEDLLDKTAIIPGYAPGKEPERLKEKKSDLLPEVSSPKSFDLHDELKSAEILIQESLFEDAKAVLRKIIIRVPENLLAKQKLKEIQEIEIKQLFNQTEPRKVRTKEIRKNPENSHEVLVALDLDLNLGELDPSKKELEFYGGREAFESEMQGLTRNLEKVPAEVLLDLGIAYFEVSFLHTARKLFELARSRMTLLSDQSLLTPVYLLALTQIQMGSYYEAISTMEPLVLDTDLPVENKNHLFYLMGRAYDGLGRDKEAKQWYEEIYGTEPSYRDVEDRIRRK